MVILHTGRRWLRVVGVCCFPLLCVEGEGAKSRDVYWDRHDVFGVGEEKKQKEGRSIGYLSLT